MTEYFENWVKRMCQSMRDKNYHSSFCALYNYFITDDKKITCVINSQTGKIGKARRYKEDAFDENIGIAIAYARCIGEPVPDMSYEPKNNDNFSYLLITHSHRTDGTTIIEYTKLNKAIKDAYPVYLTMGFRSANESEFKTAVHRNINEYSKCIYSNNKGYLALIPTKDILIITKEGSSVL